MGLSRIIHILGLSLLFTFIVQSQSTILSTEAQISLLTCDPGDDLYSIFGHSAIRVYDPSSGIDEVYNYGTFDFNDPDFYPKFLRGKLEYWLALESMPRFIRVYGYLNRSVKQEILLLDSLKKAEMYYSLIENNKLQNRYYLYDFLFDNCSTRITDLVEKTVGPLTYNDIKALSFRDMLHQYLVKRPWTQFGIDLIIGSNADEKATPREQTFLPDYLSDNLSKGNKDNGKPILASAELLLSAPEHNSLGVPSLTRPTFLFTIILILELILIRFGKYHRFTNIYDKLWIILMTISSLIISFMWFGTDHQACANNNNLVVFSPLFLLLSYWIFTNKQGKGWALISLFITLPYITLPFIKMTTQNLHSAVLLIALITLLKLVRIGNLRYFRQFL